jgi:8-oxo-dGTP diphosphatase
LFHRERIIHVTVDIVVFTIHADTLKVLLIRRGVEPFAGEWALPGGFVLPDEDLEQAAQRELAEETGTRNVYLEQLYTFGDRGRDPRGRVVTVAYYALVPEDRSPLLAGTDAAAAVWMPVSTLPRLAFDHRAIVDYAISRLQNKLDYTAVGFELLPRKFTLSDLQRLHEAILSKKLDKRNFRRKVQARGLVTPLEEWEPTGRKPAQLFAFRHER